MAITNRVAMAAAMSSIITPKPRTTHEGIFLGWSKRSSVGCHVLK
jgi:hypothetical protein